MPYIERIPLTPNEINLSRKVLIVTPPNTSFIPLGYAYLLRAWELADVEYDYVNLQLEPNFDLESLIQGNDYLAVCIGGLMGHFTFLVDFFDRIKAVAPDIPCVLGGNITTDFPNDILFSNTKVDYLIIGEGEVTNTALLQHIDEFGVSPTELLGVAFRTEDSPNGYVRNKRRQPLDLRQYNWTPYWGFLDVKKYTAPRFDGDKKFMPILTGRGCTGRCSFCSPTLGRYRGRAVDDVIEEVKSVINEFDFDYFVFVTEVFFQDEDEVIDFCSKYKALKTKKPWVCLQRVDTSPHVIKAMKDAGCEYFNVGIESGSNRILENIKKDTTVDQIKEFVGSATKCGLLSEGSFMVGNYGETEEDIIKTIDLMIELKIGGGKGFCINYPGTLNFKRAQKLGLIPDVVAYAHDICKSVNYEILDHIESHKSGIVKYVNLSEMDHEKLFSVVIREIRRLHESINYIENVTARQVSDDEDNLSISPYYSLEGTCPFCNNSVNGIVSITDIRSFDKAFCPKCFAPAFSSFFSPLMVPKINENFNLIKKLISSKKSIALIGSKASVRRMLLNGFHGFDFSKVVAAVLYDYDPSSPIKYVGNLPIINISDLKSNNIDCLVAVDLSVENLNEKISSCIDSLINTKIDVLSLFPFGEYENVPITSISKGKTLIVSSAPLEVVRHTCNMVADITHGNVHLLVQNSYPKMQVRDKSLEIYRVESDSFNSEFMSEELIDKLVNEKFDNIIYPCRHEPLYYQNVLKCIRPLKAKNVFSYTFKDNFDSIPISDVVVKRISFVKDLLSLA